MIGQMWARAEAQSVYMTRDKAQVAAVIAHDMIVADLHAAMAGFAMEVGAAGARVFGKGGAVHLIGLIAPAGELPPVGFVIDPATGYWLPNKLTSLGRGYAERFFHLGCDSVELEGMPRVLRSRDGQQEANRDVEVFHQKCWVTWSESTTHAEGGPIDPWLWNRVDPADYMTEVYQAIEAGEIE